MRATEHGSGGKIGQWFRKIRHAASPVGDRLTRRFRHYGDLVYADQLVVGRHFSPVYDVNTNCVHRSQKRSQWRIARDRALSMPSARPGQGAGLRQVRRDHLYRVTVRLCCCRVVGVHMANPRLVEKPRWNHFNGESEKQLFRRVIDFLSERNGAISRQGDTAFVHDGDFADRGIAGIVIPPPRKSTSQSDCHVDRGAAMLARGYEFTSRRSMRRPMTIASSITVGPTSNERAWTPAHATALHRDATALQMETALHSTKTARRSAAGASWARGRSKGLQRPLGAGLWRDEAIYKGN